MPDAPVMITDSGTLVTPTLRKRFYGERQPGVAHVALGASDTVTDHSAVSSDFPLVMPQPRPDKRNHEEPLGGWIPVPDLEPGSHRPMWYISSFQLMSLLSQCKRRRGVSRKGM